MAAKISFTDALRREYERLFDTCQIRPQRATAVGALVDRIVSGRPRYDAVGGSLGIPWYFVGLVHSMECGSNFKLHLHNGDPLTARTVHYPPNRPTLGEPPFSWEASAIDALSGRKVDRWTDWSRGGLLYQLEGYNGFGYRAYHPDVPTPYLWSFSAHYTCGKYVADGQWSATAVSQQCGAAVLFRAMWERGVLGEAPARSAPPATPIVAETRRIEPGSRPLIGYSPNGAETPGTRLLQAALNRILGESLTVDGRPGPQTSDALRRVTGHYLVGDPRSATPDGGTGT
jgi:lysozyme family protein